MHACRAWYSYSAKISKLLSSVQEKRCKAKIHRFNESNTQLLSPRPNNNNSNNNDNDDDDNKIIMIILK